MTSQFNLRSITSNARGPLAGQPSKFRAALLPTRRALTTRLQPINPSASRDSAHEGSQPLVQQSQQPSPLTGSEQPEASAAAWKSVPSEPSSRASQATGLAYLLLVALLWGSYTPALRFAYSLPGAITPVALTAVSGVLELVVLLAALPLGSAQQADGAEQGREGQASEQHGDASGRPADGGRAAPGLLWGLPAAVLAGAEIGAYNSAASLSQIAGLAMTTAARGAFLIQASILFTPILSSLAGASPSRSVWLGSLLAFAGTLVITADRSGGGSDGGSSSEAAASADASADLAATAAGADLAAGLPLGDALTLLAALCYSAATVRIPAWSVRRRVPAVQLALGKAVALTVVAAAGLALQAGQLTADGQPLSTLWPGWAAPEGWAVIAWAALGPGALGSVLHVKGQSLVSPSAAQIVFCTVPLWSAVLAAAVLPGEAVGAGTWLGGAVVAAAGLVAATGSSQQQQEQQEQQQPDSSRKDR